MNTYYWISASTAVIVAIGAYLLFTMGTGKKPGALFFPEDAKIVTAGKVVYATHCASCHGINLEGQPNWKRPGPDGRLPAPPHNERGHTWHHTDDVLFELTKVGSGRFTRQSNYKKSMPKYKDILSDKQIVAVLSYIKSTWPKNIREHHDRRNALNAAVKK